nr:integrase, catalytic region, zinc finger, CCHC-type, peptidase aspartic, catalytic [Tanacetum cinerariifolium]
ITQLTAKVIALQAHNDLFKAENDKIKQHYKELYDSIKITHAKHIEQVTALTTKNVNLKAQLLNTINSVSKDHVKPRVLAPGKYAIDVKPIVPRLRNNKEAHLDYLKHLKESVEAIRNIIEEAKVVRPLGSSIVSACHYTKHTQELLEYAIGTCPQDSRQRDKKLAPDPLIRKKQIILWYLDSGCSKHMPGDRSRLMNFIKKFIGIVRFGNEHFGAIMGYGDYVIGDSVISKVYYVEGLVKIMENYNQQLILEYLLVMHQARKISLRLVPNLVPATPYVPPTNKDLEILFQPMFDENLEPPRVKRLISPAPVVQALVNSADTPSSTTIDQDVPSLSISLSSLALQSHSLHQGIAAESTFIEDNPVSPVDNNPFINVFASEPSSDASSSGDVSSTKSTYVSQTLHHLSK